MKKRRGKQPVKPDMKEALTERVVSLKGKQYSTMNIPMIYRRTFGWEGDTVIFRPVNKRSFVVSRSDLPDEELRTEEYIQKELLLEDLPWYCRERASSETNDPQDMEELKEMLIALSLNDRYVDINIRRPVDRTLDLKMRSDLEFLSRDLGFVFSLVDGRYICTFVFPKHGLEQMERRASDLLLKSIGTMRSFADSLYDLDRSGAPVRISDLLYSIQTVESSMDGIYTDALNALWDPPQLEVPGHFLKIQAHEAANDELEAIAKDSLRFIEVLPKEDKAVCDLIWEEFVQVWRTSVLRSLEAYESLIRDGVDGEDVSLARIREHRVWKETGCSPQNDYISNLAQRIEELSGQKKGSVKLLASKECIRAMQTLFSINDSSSRIESISQVASCMMLYVGRGSSY